MPNINDSSYAPVDFSLSGIIRYRIRLHHFTLFRSSLYLDHQLSWLRPSVAPPNRSVVSSSRNLFIPRYPRVMARFLLSSLIIFIVAINFSAAASFHKRAIEAPHRVSFTEGVTSVAFKLRSFQYCDHAFLEKSTHVVKHMKMYALLFSFMCLHSFHLQELVRDEFVADRRVVRTVAAQ